jgi:uncharacterized protein YecE (DUF72 family)
MVWIGTSGFQYPEWKGSFYPEDLSAKKMLPYYAARFSTTEINYSFYRIPTVKTLDQWAAETPAAFRFSFKAPKEITHIRRLRDAGPTLKRFADAIRTMKRKAGPILFQLPPFFKKDVPLLIDFLAGTGKRMDCAFEFRHASWFADDTFAALRKHNAALCIADTEDLTTPAEFTATFGYFRLRREDYTKKDLARWSQVVSRERSRLQDCYIYFKHEETGVGPVFARQFEKMLRGGSQ